jgi:hypothetical protein
MKMKSLLAAGLFFTLVLPAMADDEAQVVKDFRFKVEKMSTSQKIQARIRSYEMVGNCLAVPVGYGVDLALLAAGPYETQSAGDKLAYSCAFGLARIKVLNESQNN